MCLCVFYMLCVYWGGFNPDSTKSVQTSMLSCMSLNSVCDQECKALWGFIILQSRTKEENVLSSSLCKTELLMRLGDWNGNLSVFGSSHSKNYTQKRTLVPESLFCLVLGSLLAYGVV